MVATPLLDSGIDVLDGVRKSRSGHVARCPAHDDRHASLSVTERDGKVLVKCQAGCSQAAVIDALRALGGWPSRPERRRAAKKSEKVWRIGRPDGRFSEHHRVDKEDGTKTVWWTTGGVKGLDNLPVAELHLYGVEDLPVDGTIVITEGETAKDAVRR